MTQENVFAPLLTLTTDFGLDDSYVGIMKGVILGIAPQARIVDITHSIAPQNVLEGCLRLEPAVEYFPTGTVHIAVVDPGVGSEREALIIETDRFRFLVPNNGIISFLLKKKLIRRVIQITERARPYQLPDVSTTFHGRDLFAPLAAHIACGLAPDQFGVERDPTDLITLDIPEPQIVLSEAGHSVLLGHALYADHFGNLITDVTPEWFTRWKQTQADPEIERRLLVCGGNAQWYGISRTYSDVPPGAPLLYWGSAGRLEIGMRNGNAAHSLALSPGDTFSLSR
jgi:S-adenosylmethionine hydrolase